MLVWELTAIWVASVAVATVLGRRKARRGALYGIFLSWLGVVLLLLLPPGRPHEVVPGDDWDETPGARRNSMYGSPDDAFFKNQQYYSKY